jgi:hypothetical protein
VQIKVLKNPARARRRRRAAGGGGFRAGKLPSKFDSRLLLKL